MNRIRIVSACSTRRAQSVEGDAGSSAAEPTFARSEVKPCGQTKLSGISAKLGSVSATRFRLIAFEVSNVAEVC
jgi:hypothetical protein